MLIDHAQCSIRLGAEVYISTPRIKNELVTGEKYCSILQEIYHRVPEAKIILTTREEIEFINKMIDIISVVSLGSVNRQQSIPPKCHERWAKFRH